MYCVFPCVTMELLRNTVVFNEVLLKPFPTSTRRWARTEKPKIMDMYICKPFILSTFHNGTVEESLNHLRQNCDNVNTHITLF